MEQMNINFRGIIMKHKYNSIIFLIFCYVIGIFLIATPYLSLFMLGFDMPAVFTKLIFLLTLFIMGVILYFMGKKTISLYFLLDHCKKRSNQVKGVIALILGISTWCVISTLLVYWSNTI